MNTVAPTAPAVLAIDDDAATRRALGGIITAAGFRPVLVDALEAAATLLTGDDPPRVALIDWLLPDGSGIDLIRRVREASRVRPYLIMVTIKADTADIVTGLDAGADDYISKPVKPAEVQARIRAGFRMIALQTELSARVAALEEANSRVRQLEGLLPICMYCRRIRDERESWLSLEEYVTAHAEVRFSHGCCPRCYRELCGDLTEEKSGSDVPR